MSAARPIATRAATPTGEIIPLVGAMTNASREVNEHLGRLDMGPKVTRFLRRLEHHTFSQAGRHRDRGHERPGVWCYFDLEDFAAYCAVAKSQVCHIRKRLADDGIIFYDPRSGRMEWNLDFAQWRPLQADYPRWGGARRNAGCKHTGPGCTHKQPAIDNLNGSASEQPGIDNLNDSSHSSYQSQPFKISTLASHETAAGLDSGDAPKNGEKEARKKPQQQPARARDTSARVLVGPTALSGLPDALRAELEAVIAELRLAGDWKADDAKDADLVRSLAERHGRPVDWLRLQAESFRLWEGDEASPPVRHNRKNFLQFCTGPVADSKLARFLEGQDENARRKHDRQTHPERRGADRGQSRTPQSPVATRAANRQTGQGRDAAGDGTTQQQPASRAPERAAYDPFAWQQQKPGRYR
jgi:hypothetical protein